MPALIMAPDPVVARLVNGERLTILGWSRAILLQMAHPLIAAGVAQHSTFRGGARHTAMRMHGTIKAMLALTFGDHARREATLAHIRGIHQRVNGTLTRSAGPFEAGTPYTANDPQLLLWVHATVLESIAMIYGLVIGPLTAASLDRLCDESAATLVDLGGDGASAPRSWSALTHYIEGVHRSGVLHVTSEGREIAEAVLSPRVAGMPVPGGSLHRALTIGLLPPAVRQAYGFPWSDRHQRRLERIIRTLRVARRMTPDLIATWQGRSAPGHPATVSVPPP